MALSYVSISHGDLGGSGIDALSSEDAIQDGYAEDLLNVDASPQGYLSKRVGYQQMYGQLPVRILGMEYKSTDLSTIEFTLDASIDLSNIPGPIHSRPIVVSGRTSSLNPDSGDFPTTGITSQYYPEFNADTRRAVLPNVLSTIQIPATEHGLSTPYMFIGTSVSTNAVNRNNSQFLPDSVSINEASYGISITQTNSTPATLQEYVYWADKTPVPGFVFKSANATIPANSSTPLLYTTATHGLTSRNLQVQVYQIVAGSYLRIFPESVKIALNGDVTVILQNSTELSMTVFCILSTVDPDKAVANISKNTTEPSFTVVIKDPPTPFSFISCYRTAEDAALEQVIPDSIEYDDDAKEIRVQFETGTIETLAVFWEPGYIISNKLRVAAKSAATQAFNDSNPQLTLWGLDHSHLYLNPKENRPGWVTHLDTYRSAGNNFLVAGLGGNLFSGSELGNEDRVTYKVPFLYPNLRARILNAVTCGPAFVSNTEPYSVRTNGAIAGTGWGTGFAVSSTINYVDPSVLSIQGLVKIVLETTNLKKIAEEGHVGPINPITANTDWLTIQEAGNSIHNGTWLIQSFTITESTLLNPVGKVELFVLNTAIKALVEENTELVGTTAWNSTTGAKCGIFSGTMTVTTGSPSIPVPFVPGDIIVSSNLTASEPIQVATVSGSNLNLLNFYQNETFPSSTSIVGRRTSAVLPLRDGSDVANADNFVGTDNVQVGGYLRQFKVKSVNSLPTTQILSILVSSGIATVTLSSTPTASPTNRLAAGDKLTLVAAGIFSGDVLVTGILDGTRFQFETDETTSVTSSAGYLMGKTLYLDEEITWEDTLASTGVVNVPGRWIPLEAPDHTQSEAPTTYKRYLANSAYDNQPIVRSTQVADTLFLNNGDDRTLKVDGSSLYRPGLIKWQPQLFFAQATGPGFRSIPLIKTSITVTGWANNHFSVSENDVNAFPVGTKIRRSGDATTVYTVTSIQTGTGSSIHQIFVDKTILGTYAITTPPEQITTLSTYSYYFRLNAVDANQNVIASAATGAFDSTINVTDDFQNRIRLIGLPALDIYDYDRLEVQIYRTKQNGVAPYYLLTTQVLNFAQNNGYLDWTDTIADDALGVTQLDPVNTALKGQELGTGWTAPVRAKHLTSAANRMVLGNLTSDPYIDLVIRNIGSSVSSSQMDGSRFLLRKNNVESGLETNMVDRVGFRFTTDNKLTIQGISATAGGFQVTTSGAHNLQPGHWTYLFRSNLVTASLALPGAVNTGTETITQNGHGYLANQQFTLSVSAGGSLPNPLATSTVYYVVNPTTNTFQLATTPGGSAVNLTSAGSGTLYLTSLNPETYFMGWWQVKSVPVGSTTTFLVDWPGRPSTFSMGDQVNSLVTAYAASGVGYDTRHDVPVYLGEDFNFQTTNGQPSSTGLGIQNLATRRWAAAINATQRMTNRSVNGQTLFTPWIVGNAGGEYAEGQIVLTQPMNVATTFELVLPNQTGYSVFANGVQRSSGEQVQAREDLHPSRILISYPNFPEIFDSPFVTVDSQSDSAIDINPADGQEITAVIPFFGSSAFGAALKDAVVVVFKTNSIYVVNLAAKLAGQVAVQKIESQGLGCTASYSVAPVRDGIMFANASGIYKLRTDLSLYYMGRYMQRQWRTRVNKTNLGLIFGHNWAFGSQFKLSLPTGSSLSPDETFVYNSTREYSLEGPNTQAHREGSWTRQRGFQAIGWCNLDADSFYANVGGQVMRLRQTGEASDWRDDDKAISMDIVLRAMDFGDDGVRKTVPYSLISYRNPVNLGVRTGTEVFYTTDLYDIFLPADATVIPNRAEDAGLSDIWSQKVVTFRYSFQNKRGIRFQLRITNSQKDESVEVARVRYSVAGLNIRGTLEAARSPAISRK